MSLIWADGFENSSLWTRKYTLTGSTLPTTTTGRSGNGCLLTGGGTASAIRWGIPSAQQHATIIIGFAAKWLSTTAFPATTGDPFIRFLGDNGSTTHNFMYFATTGGGTANMTRGTASIGTTSTTFTDNVWYYIEIKCVLGDGTAGQIVVNVNGVQALDTGGTDTKNAGTGSVYDTIVIPSRNSASQNTVIDDLYILNGAGSVYNNFLGDVTIETLRPNGNGNSSQFTGSDGNSTDNYLLVDEATYDSADYVQSSTTNHKDLYTYSDLAASSGSVKGVVAYATAQKTASGAQNFRQISRISSTDYNGSSVALDTSDLPRTQVWEQSPATSSDWTISEVNGAEFGVEVL